MKYIKTKLIRKNFHSPAEQEINLAALRAGIDCFDGQVLPVKFFAGGLSIIFYTKSQTGRDIICEMAKKLDFEVDHSDFVQRNGDKNE